MPEDNRVARNWRKSTRSGADNCVLVAITRDLVYVRDSKDPDGPILTFSAQAWESFLRDTRSGALQE